MASGLATTSLYNDANLVAYYALEDLTDPKGSHTLTNNGGVIFTPARYYNGASGGAANAGAYLTVANNLGIDGGSCGFTIWIKANASIASGTWTIIEQVGNTSQVAYQLQYQYNSGTPQIYWARNKIGVASVSVTKTITLDTTTYHLICGSYNSGTSTLQLWVDDVSAGTTTQSGNGSTALANSYNLLSQQGGGNYASMTVDDNGVFTRGLTQSDVDTLWAVGPGSAAGEAFLFNFV